MAALKTDNPFDKKAQLAQWTLFQALKSGKTVSVDEVGEKLGHPISNRSIGYFLRTAEDTGLRFVRVKVQEKGVTYRMYEGDGAKKLDRISVPFQNYLTKSSANGKRPAKKTAAKKETAKASAPAAKSAAVKKTAKAPVAKTAVKAAVKKVAPAASVAKKTVATKRAAPAQAVAKKKGIGRGGSTTPTKKISLTKK